MRRVRSFPPRPRATAASISTPPTRSKAEIAAARRAAGIRPSAGRSATPTRRCGARSSSRRWSGRTSTTTRFATPTGTTPRCRSRSMIAPKIEPEIVFKLAKTPASSDPAAVLEATEWYALGFEIIDCVFPDWKFQPADFVAARGLHAALVVGEPVYVEPEDIAAAGDRSWPRSRCGCSGTTSWSRKARRRTRSRARRSASASSARR